jgi:hypothetical protein
MSHTPAYSVKTETIKSLMLQEFMLLERIAQQDAPPHLLVKHLATHEALDQQLQSLDRQLDEQLMETGLEQAERFNLWVLGILALVGTSGWLIAFILHRREARGAQSYSEEVNLED